MVGLCVEMRLSTNEKLRSSGLSLAGLATRKRLQHRTIFERRTAPRW